MGADVCPFFNTCLYTRGCKYLYPHNASCTLLTHLRIHTHTLIHYDSRLCWHEQVQQQSSKVLIESKISGDSVGSYQYVQASSLEMSSTEPASGTAGKC